ncbi:MAG: hypothetical protein LIO74_00945 [Ruminococcus sp.]|nr:hypothetical protein [Ruminococcus sp.]
MQKKQPVTLPVFDETAPYTIALNYYRDGFLAFQKKFVMKRNYITIIAFFILMIVMVISAVQTGMQMYYLLLLVCLACIFILWYNPRKQRRMVIDAVRDLEDERYTASCNGKCLRIQTVQTEEEREKDPIPESRIDLDTAWVEDMDEFFLVCDVKKMFYILPKTALHMPFSSETLIGADEDKNENTESIDEN